MNIIVLLVVKLLIMSYLLVGWFVKQILITHGTFAYEREWEREREREREREQ